MRLGHRAECAENGEEALNPDNLMCRAIRAIKQACGDEIGVLTDASPVPVDVEDDGSVFVGATNEENARKAIAIIESLTTTPEVGQKLIDCIHWWEDYTSYFGGSIDNNPSPGNKLGGLSNIYEKSLGAAAKAGSTPLNQVVGYGEKVTERGFVHMDSPGYDPVSVTGQVAGGCNVVVFTTGRGSAFGYKPAPSIKIATNSILYANQEPDMDINAGRVLDGISLEQLGEEISTANLVISGTTSVRCSRPRSLPTDSWHRPDRSMCTVAA